MKTAEEKWDALRVHIAAIRLQAKQDRDGFPGLGYDFAVGEYSGIFNALSHVEYLMQRMDQE